MRAREWLGRAYYMSGLEDSALSIWNSLIDAGHRSTNLENMIEIVSTRRKMFDTRRSDRNLVVEHEISGDTRRGGNLFRRPGAVLPLDNGGFIVSSFTTNELLVFNANSRVINRFRGGLGAINNPFDVIKSSDGFFVVTEYGGNQVAILSHNGTIVRKFGSRGSGPGQFLGPQFIASNGAGHFFVSDWGNRRVSKFDYDGNFILSFGNRTGRYEGLRGPTGVLVLNNIVFVADVLRRSIDLFDQSGNFIRTIGRGMLHGPEGLSAYGNNSILIADTDRVVIFNIEHEFAEVIFTSETPGRIAFARYNANNDLMISDFNNNSVMFLSEMESIFEGLFVRIDSIYAENFPTVRIRVNVEKRNHDPIVGLERANFRVTEGGRAVDDLTLLFQSNQSRRADVAIVVEDSLHMTGRRDILRRALNEVYNSFDRDDRIRVVSAGRTATLVAEETVSRADAIAAVMQANSASADFSIGTGIRLAASQIVSSMDKKAVIFIYSGNPAPFNFNQYRLVDIMQFLRNNNISFYYISLERGQSREELDFLVRETGGARFFIHETAGIGRIAQKIRESRSGTYLLEYRSRSFDEFGRRYIPVRVEAVFNRRSGRDELGYFSEAR